MNFSEIWERFIEVIYPNVCVLCGEVLEYGNRRGVCGKCEKDYPYLSGELCSCCGKPLIELSSDLCHDCRKRPHLYTEGRSMWPYEDLVQESVQAYKYKECQENGHLFAKELCRYYNGIKHWPVDMVIPVPLHKKRLRQRGYNQARIIAEYFAKCFDYEIASKDVLRRVRDTDPQKMLNDKDRYINVDNAFVAHETAVRDKNILLIDDIYTTGSTIDGCAKVLRDNGAREVFYLAIAIGRGL